MQIEINGKTREVSPELTIAALLEAEELNRAGVAVAVNREVVRRADWENITFSEGDRVEIIHAVQGG